MNGIENIIKKISDDAEREAEKILSEARASALKTEEEYKQKADAIKAEASASASAKAEENFSRLVAGHAMSERQKTLKKKQDLISSAFDAAYEKLISLSADERVDIIASLALRAADGREGEIILSSSDREKLSSDIMKKVAENPKITLSETSANIDGGLIFKRGTTEINCTFRALVDEMRDTCAREVADILFG